MVTPSRVTPSTYLDPGTRLASCLCLPRSPSLVLTDYEPAARFSSELPLLSLHPLQTPILHLSSPQNRTKQLTHHPQRNGKIPLCNPANRLPPLHPPPLNTLLRPPPNPPNPPPRRTQPRLHAATPALPLRILRHSHDPRRQPRLPALALSPHHQRQSRRRNGARSRQSPFRRRNSITHNKNA